MSDKSGLISNTGFLFVLQISSYIFPFITIPYLTRALGVELYGVLAFILTFGQLLCILTDFGYNLSATKKIAENIQDSIAIRRIIGAVFMVKFFLILCATFLVYVFLLVQEDKYGMHSQLFWILILSVIGQTLQPIWFFQGIERMKYITFFLVFSKVMYLSLIISLVDNASDLPLAVLSYGVAQLTAGAVAIYLMLRMGYSPLLRSRQDVYDSFKESSEFFWSRLGVSTYSSGPVFFLGMFSSSVNVAYYSAAEQLYKAAQALLQPVSQSLYPYMARTRDLILFRKVFLYILLVLFIGLGIGFLTGEWFLTKIYGDSFYQSYLVLQILLVALLFSSMAIMLGYPLLGAFQMISYANRSVLYAAGIQLGLLTVLWALDLYGIAYVASTVLFVEFFVFCYRTFYVRNIRVNRNES
jgi:PST family polysaccharide transporter